MRWVRSPDDVYNKTEDGIELLVPWSYNTLLELYREEWGPIRAEQRTKRTQRMLKLVRGATASTNQPISN